MLVLVIGIMILGSLKAEAIDFKYMNPYTGNLAGTLNQSDIEALVGDIYVDVTGDTMTGDLTINGADLCFDSDTCVSFDGTTVTLTVNGSTRQTWSTIPTAEFLLLESGDYLLLENGDNLILE